MCQRYLSLPVRLIAAGGVLVLIVLLFGFLRFSGRLKNKVDRWEVSSQDVLAATQNLVATNPSVRNLVSFSAPDQTKVERWQGRRWRVSGYFDTSPQPGVKVRTLYFAVVQQDGKDWNLEDLQLQSMELAPSGSPGRF